jgi:hypothetical protein
MQLASLAAASVALCVTEHRRARPPRCLQHAARHFFNGRTAIGALGKTAQTGLKPHSVGKAVGLLKFAFQPAISFVRLRPGAPMGYESDMT